MRFLLIAALAAVFAFSAHAQIGVDSIDNFYEPLTPPKPPKPRVYNPDPRPFAGKINVETSRRLVEALTAPEMAGRETGQEGQRIAADYIAAEFRVLGLPHAGDNNSFLQKIILEREPWDELAIKSGDRAWTDRTDFYAYPRVNPDVPLITATEVVFVGYGIADQQADHYAGADVQGKVVLFYDGEPVDANGNSLLTGRFMRTKWSMDWLSKVEVAKSKGAAACLIIDPNFVENQKKNRSELNGRRWKPAASDPARISTLYTNSAFITPEVAAAMLGSKASKMEKAHADLLQKGSFKPIKFKAKLELRMDKDVQRLEGSNVIGFIEGSDEKLKKEYVIITAHYDHLGQSDSLIYYGADDNASGTAGVIQIAQAFVEAKNKGLGPKRSIICMLVSGEEKGLLGSEFYTTFPLFPLDKTIANINIDMIGRVDAAHANNPDYIYVIGSDRMSKDLHQLHENINSDFTKLELDYKYNNPSDPNRYYERSDHYNFVLKGIPAIFYFNGTHPDYHKVTDTPDKINHEALVKRTQLAFFTAWELANRLQRPSLNRKQ